MELDCVAGRLSWKEREKERGDKILVSLKGKITSGCWLHFSGVGGGRNHVICCTAVSSAESLFFVSRRFMKFSSHAQFWKVLWAFPKLQCWGLGTEWLFCEKCSSAGNCLILYRLLGWVHSAVKCLLSFTDIITLRASNVLGKKYHVLGCVRVVWSTEVLQPLSCYLCQKWAWKVLLWWQQTPFAKGIRTFHLLCSVFPDKSYGVKNWPSWLKSMVFSQSTLGPGWTYAMLPLWAGLSKHESDSSPGNSMPTNHKTVKVSKLAVPCFALFCSVTFFPKDSQGEPGRGQVVLAKYDSCGDRAQPACNT